MNDFQQYALYFFGSLAVILCFWYLTIIVSRICFYIRDKKYRKECANGDHKLIFSEDCGAYVFHRCACFKETFIEYKDKKDDILIIRMKVPKNKGIDYLKEIEYSEERIPLLYRLSKVPTHLTQYYPTDLLDSLRGLLQGIKHPLQLINEKAGTPKNLELILLNRLQKDIQNLLHIYAGAEKLTNRGK